MITQGYWGYFLTHGLARVIATPNSRTKGQEVNSRVLIKELEADG